MDQELLAFLDQRFTEAREHAEGLATETREFAQGLAAESRRHAEGLVVETREFAQGLATETRRHFDVVAESLRSDIRLVAEGHTTLARQLDEQRREQDMAHREILAAVKLSYGELDHRITRLEAVSADLEGRLARLEARR